jgi:two-component system, NarL family, sensor histidine kinase BarA
MSYRAFKRLLGETSLERKCRFLFGAFILLLIAGSFLFYANRTEHVAYEQIKTTCRLLVNQIIDHDLATVCRPVQQPTVPVLVAASTGLLGSALGQGPLLTSAALLPVKTLRPEENPAQAQIHDADRKKTAEMLNEFRNRWMKTWPEGLKTFEYLTFKPNAVNPENKPNSIYSAARFREFQEQKDLEEVNHQNLSERINDFYGAIRATHTCLACHRQSNPALQENDLIAVIKITVPMNAIDNEVNINRAVLISTALITALLIMVGSYVIVRYVIVKPVKHLKEVSDAISAGELNVRSEIQTGDEFEDLSHAFNRMLRNLVSMQDRLRKVNGDLDRKVDELAQANLALYESNRLKGDFLATMSHELRTPLNSILGFGEVLVSSVGLTEKQMRWVNNIRSSGEQLLNLINDILDLAKIEAGKMQVRLVEFSSYDVCEGMMTMFRPLAEKKNIDLRSQLSPAIPVLRQDVVKLQQILSNLLSNAIKFTPEGGRVLLKAETDGPDIVLTVSDTGVGIAPEEKELVFEKFRQSGNPLTREHAGTGLGLSIVRELTKLLGGEVTLQSELGRGSTFTVRLPLQLSEEPRLEFDLANEGIDLSKAQRVDTRLYQNDTASKPVVSH